MTHRWPGVPLALASAALFGASTPFAKLLLGAVDPWLMAGLLYLGAGLGPVPGTLARAAPRPPAAPAASWARAARGAGAGWSAWGPAAAASRSTARAPRCGCRRPRRRS